MTLKLRSLILFVIIATLFNSCSPEQNYVSESPSANGSVKKISFDEFSLNLEALKYFKKVEAINNLRKLSKNVKDSILHFEVDTDQVGVTEKDGEFFYTFLIQRDYETTITENLLLKQSSTGDYVPIFLEYNFSEEDKVAVKNGENVQGIASKTTVIQPEEIGLDDSGESGKFITCVVISVPYCTSESNHDNGAFPDGSNCHAHAVLEIYFCEGGAGGSDAGGMPPSNPGPYNPTPGGHSGWGSTAGGTPVNYIVTVPLVEEWKTAQNNFIKSLNLQDRSWLLDSSNTAIKNELFLYLIINQ